MKVLIAEDNEKNRKLLRDFLISCGHEVVYARNGREAVAIALSERPAVVLMDIQMPDMGGTEAMKIIKSNKAYGGMPIIAITSYAMQGDREKFVSEGFDGYLSKPVDLNELLKLIKEVGNESNL